MNKIDSGLHERLVALMKVMGVELWGVDVIPQRSQLIFRLYIDREGGVTSDDCSKVSRQVSAMLDVENTFQDRYILEVSSPGIDRPLFDLEQYRKQLGKRIQVRLHSPIDGRRQLKGLLLTIENEELTLLLDDIEQKMTVPFAAIDKGKLCAEVSF